MARPIVHLLQPPAKGRDTPEAMPHIEPRGSGFWSRLPTRPSRLSRLRSPSSTWSTGGPRSRLGTSCKRRLSLASTCTSRCSLLELSLPRFGGWGGGVAVSRRQHYTSPCLTSNQERSGTQSGKVIRSALVTGNVSFANVSLSCCQPRLGSVCDVTRYEMTVMCEVLCTFLQATIRRNVTLSAPLGPTVVKLATSVVAEQLQAVRPFTC